MNEACSHFVDSADSLDKSPTVQVLKVVKSPSTRALSDSEPTVNHVVTLHTGKGDPLCPPPKLIEVKTRDGVATLHGALYLPDASSSDDPDKPPMYPLIVSVYGGPCAQRVARQWRVTCDKRAQSLRRLGFAVLKLDGRGSARRGLEFEGWIKHCMGTVEVDDQVDGVNALAADGIIDPSRVGIYGWSVRLFRLQSCLPPHIYCLVNTRRKCVVVCRWANAF